MTVRVKICGVNSAAAFDAAAEAAADWVGFVFYPPSPRYVTASAAALLSSRLRGGPRRVGLFVEPTDDELAEVLDRVDLHALQLYGAEPRLGVIRAKFGKPVWRALTVNSKDDLPEGAGVAAALVLEAAAPPGAARPGGNGVKLDWTMLAGWEPDAPWLLAGGLSPDNVAEAIAVSGASAVDVSSGVESAPGVKDPGLIAGFVRAARGG